MGDGIALLGVDEAREEERVSDEEDGGVVAHQVPISLFRVELDGEASRIPGAVSGAGLSSHRAEADCNRCLLPHLAEQIGLEQDYNQLSATVAVSARK